MTKDVPRSYFRIGLLSGILALAISLLLQAALLRQLSVFNTAIGLWLMALQFVLYTVVILILTILGSFISATVQRRTGRKLQWVLYYLIIGLAAWAVFADGINFGLGQDVKYGTLLGKSGIDYLSLHYLNGATIWTLLILTALFMLSDPRVTYRVGDDGKRHPYMHSKFMGLIRLLRTSNLGQFLARPRRRRWMEPLPPSTPPPGQIEWDIGKTPDHAVISKDGKMYYNDRFRASSPWFLGWTFFKFLLGILVAGALSDNTALRFVTIQNYLVQTNSTWLAQLSNYFGILAMRISGTYVVSSNFAINNTFTFEVYSFVELFLGLAFILIGLRLGLAAIANFMVGISTRAFAMSRRGASEILGIILLPMIYFFLGAGAWVYDVGTSFSLWTLIFGMAAVAFFAALARTRRVLTLANINRTRAILLVIIVLIPVFTIPSYGAFLRGQSGKYIDYQWTPAYVPTIDYTRWAYQVDNVNSTDKALITATNLNQSQLLSHVRVFTQDAAKLSMRPFVPVNWLSIDNAGVDIIFVNGTEYWVSILQLVHPAIANDPDTWRTNHLLLTNSERILAVNAANAQNVSIAKIWPSLSQTPQVYYGEGGLWTSVDEVYLNIPTFPETRITGYVGPASYDGKPDYTYAGFWRYWKFFWQGRLDFANGNYGDIKALVNRDVDERVSNLLLPSMTMDSDPYPVVDPNGNIYLLHWVWIDWKSPHDFADYPDHADTSILRLFAPVLTNVKTGQVTGYLYNQRDDYILSFYKSMYPQWNQPIPSWLTPQLRYPQGFFDNQTGVYDFYFQNKPDQWQRNAFLQNTEDTRFIITPINGVLSWAAVRLVEAYQSPSKILAGLYVAPAGAGTGQVYLIRFPEGTTIIGPESAISAVITDPAIKGQLSLHPDWLAGNILMYAVNEKLTYIIPYYGTQSNLNVPVMVAAVDGGSKQVGHYFINKPNDPVEVQNAAYQAYQNIGLGTTAGTTISGTVADPVYSYVQSGNTQWVIDITTGSGKVTVYGSADKLSQTDKDKIRVLITNSPVSVQVDSNYNIIKVN